jgi:hypothetical protein
MIGFQLLETPFLPCSSRAINAPLTCEIAPLLAMLSYETFHMPSALSGRQGPDVEGFFAKLV